ncbi:PREDICTED: outer dense fiber protein 2-like isoform X1 [Lepidothrix coronata]|uniref:Outer dense fiber protein 2-like isoform X1 n=2 Tax=Lepidothrix coronata TaxID=321398 RepID=A0A6J0GGV8_9PASS|nr:PREDICTED: outer dense fiber protein 2-like isoform X1 [Lepidothrix coronata]XP_017661134.1 PREDICTED: outer dense fiber protein 2-like isoform X1 [Lepidothrix coronata]XP_017661135.1 PREDICTED: outer dense fiber protein 2-like isoform X1 [Lepidothrix coronata]XP_017661136.1 PREDICTED: outer dense fiber protein 2-like isoform X1 [Lepidothrix coronata]
MSSSSQSSSSLPVFDCTSPLVDFDPQEKFILPHATELNSEIIDTLIQKLSENETQNTNLRKKILEREKQIKELSSMLQCEKINTQKGNHLSRSVKEVQAHLQCQIQRKEAENGELKVKIQNLEKKIAKWKHQVGEYKHQKSALKETSEQNKIALKKAMWSQKQRAQFFEEAAKNLTSKIREHEVKLREILSTADVWKSQHDRMLEEKTMLEIQTEDLKNQITSLLEELERRKEWRRNSEEEILRKLNSGNSENEKIYLENEKLKASIATLEKSTVSVEHELLHLQEKAKLQENLVEQHKNEVQKLQIAAEELKSRYERVLNENKKITENKCLEEDKLLKLRINSESEYEFSSAFFFCDISFNGRDDNNVTSMGSLSLEEENCNIQRKYEALKRQLGKMEFQNEELACQLRTQDQSLQCSKLKLEEKIAEYNALTRQLESALEKGRKMVAEEQEKMSYKEQAFQTKLLVLETEVREGKEEKKQLLCIFHHNEKHHEICLKELENSLQKSENKNQSIQNYVQFLKAAYITMFG